LKKKHILLATLETKYANLSLWEKIQQLDLQGIFDRMIVKYKWSKRRTEKAVREYREFLYISQVLETSLSPTTEADEIWHQHILHTKKYADDCKKTFGRFLHHYPFSVVLKKVCGVCETNEEKVDCKCDIQRTKAAFCGLKGDEGYNNGSGYSNPEDGDKKPKNKPKENPKPKPKPAVKKPITKKQAFCGVDGDGDEEEEKPQPKPKKRVLQKSVCDGGGDCRIEDEVEKPKKQFVNLADVRAQFFVLN